MTPVVIATGTGRPPHADVRQRVAHRGFEHGAHVDRDHLDPGPPLASLGADPRRHARRGAALDLHQQPGTPTRSTSPTCHRSATTSQISPPSGASTSRNFAFPRRVSSIPRCVTGGVSFGSAASAAAVNAVFATGPDTSKSRGLHHRPSAVGDRFPDRGTQPRRQPRPRRDRRQRLGERLAPALLVDAPPSAPGPGRTGSPPGHGPVPRTSAYPGARQPGPHPTVGTASGLLIAGDQGQHRLSSKTRNGMTDRQRRLTSISWVIRW